MSPFSLTAAFADNVLPLLSPFFSDGGNLRIMCYRKCP
jgi:hypothetical protein